MFDSLASFLPGYYDGMRVLLTEQDFGDLACVRDRYLAELEAYAAGE